MVRHVSSAGAFFLLGIGGVIVPLAILLVMFRRAGYFGGDGI
jgi:hypothetical protein